MMFLDHLRKIGGFLRNYKNYFVKLTRNIRETDISEKRIFGFLFLFVSLFIATPAFSAIPQFLTNAVTETSGNGVAIIGEQITYYVYFNSDVTPILAQVQLYPSDGRNMINLAEFVASPTHRAEYTWTVTEGNQNGVNTPSQFILTNQSGPVVCAANNTIVLDNMPPRRNGPLQMTVNAAAYTGQVIHKNDCLIFTQPMTTAAFQAGETAVIDMSAFGLGTIPMSSANPHVSGSYVLTAALDTTQDISFSAQDPNGNATSAVGLTSVIIDSIPPVITTTNVVVSPSGTARPGSQVTVTVTIQAYDGDTVTASNTFLGGTSLNLPRVGATNDFQNTFVVASSPTMTPCNGQTKVDVFVTDNGGNLASASTSQFSLDNRLPDMPAQPAASLVQGMGVLTDGIGIIGDTLRINATATWDPTQTVNVYADLSSLVSGWTQVQLSQVGQNSFALNQVLISGQSEDSPTKSFKVWAIDSVSGNTVQQWTTPFLAIDNVPPALVSAYVTRISGTGSSYKVGDQFRIRAQINNLSTTEMGAIGDVTVQLASLSVIYTNTQKLNADLANPGFFQGDFTVGSFTPYCGWNGIIDIRIVASDAQGNLATGTANSVIPIDNEPPVLDGPVSQNATYTSNPTVSTTHPYVRIGDQVTLRVRLASSTTATHDGETVSADLSSMGSPWPSNQVLTWSGGWYQYQFTVQAGLLNNGATFPITITDNDGNTLHPTTIDASITMPMDQVPLKPTNRLLLTVNKIDPAKDSFGTNVINLNRSLAFTWPIVDIDNGSCTLDLSLVGSSSVASMNWSPNTYASNLNADLTNVTSEGSNYYFTAVMTDKAGNSVSTTTAQAFTVDCIPPVLDGPISQTATYTSNPVVSTTHPYVRIGDQVTLRVCLASSTTGVHDGETVLADLSTMGTSWPNNQALTWSGGWYQYQFTVQSGLLNDGATFPISISDNDGNTLYPPTIDASITMPMDQVPLKPTDRLGVTVSKIDPAGDVFGTNVINLNRSLAFNWPLVDTDNGSCTIDLSLVGSSSVASMIWLPNAYTSNLNATSTNVTSEVLNYAFTAVMSDKGGNSISTTTAQAFTIDCIPPTFDAASVTIFSPVGATMATPGTTLRFSALARNIEGSQYPNVDLTKIGGTANEILAPAGGNLYTLNFVIAQPTAPAVGYNNQIGTFNFNCQDDVQNKASATAISTFTIDNVAVIASLQVLDQGTLTPTANPIAIGRSLRYLVTVTPADWANVAADSAFIDLSTVGSTTSAQMMWFPATGAFYLDHTSATATYETTNYYFKVNLKDNGGIPGLIYSDASYTVDCLPASFVNHGIFFTAVGGNNPDPLIANASDTITVFASVAAYIDAVPVATLSSGSTILNQWNMTYNAATQRHEAVFNIPTDGSWGNINMESLNYRLTANDDVGNWAVSVGSASGFFVDLVAPTIASGLFWISPNIPDVGYLNVGSASSYDLFWASATLANNEQVASAYLDLSAYPGAPSCLAVPFSNSWAGSGSISLSNYSQQDVISPNLVLTMLDRGGNKATYTAAINVDTRRPIVATSSFEGTTLSVGFQSTEQLSSANLTQWTINGSYGGLATSVVLGPQDTPAINAVNLNVFDVTLSLNHRQILAGWASTPITLTLTNTATPAVVDLSGNWGTTTSNYPITLTSSMWRQSPLISAITVAQNWPTDISLIFQFSKDMATNTLDLSKALLLALPQVESSVVDYTTRYVFESSATSSWNDPRNLIVTLRNASMEWIAKKLASGATTLKYSSRPPYPPPLVKDYLLRNLAYSSSTAPIEAVVTRPTSPGYSFEVDPTIATPVLDLNTRSLKLALTDRALLTKNDFNQLSPTLAVTNSGRTTTFQNNIEIHDYLATYAVLTFLPLDLTLNPSPSSTSINISLSDSDVAKVMGVMMNNSAPDWKLKVNSGAFQNWWGQNNVAYLPTTPGFVDVVTLTTQIASLMAASINDPPPTINAAPGSLLFEFEFLPYYVGNVPVPLASNTPSARIVSSSSIFIASGTFSGWSTRSVDGKTRYVARFANELSLPNNLQLWESKLEIFDVRDVFGKTISATGTNMVYDMTQKNDGAAGGFNTASQALIIDTQIPYVAGILPTSTVTRRNAGAGTFEVNFNEPMNTSVIPTLTLATDVATITFSFSSWTNGNQTAQFKNVEAITSSLVNGTWTYTLIGGQDIAGNVHTGPSTFDVQVRTQIPQVVLNGVMFSSIQNTISTVTLYDQPFSPYVSPGLATLTLSYSSTPTQLPHYFNFYTSNGALTGSSTIILSGGQWMATVDGNSFRNPGRIGPATYTLRVSDGVGNETDDLRTIVYDGASPTIDYFNLSNIGTFTGNVYYYSPVIAVGNVLIHATNASDDLLLASYSLSTNSTATYALNQSPLGTYSCSLLDGRGVATYVLSIVDLAGNLFNGPPLTLVLDTVAPDVANIMPSGSAIGQTTAGNATFTVTFKERMDPAVIPTLTLSMGATTINTTWVKWANGNNATTAYYINTTAIDPSIPPGTYTYTVAGGRDLAQNPFVYAPTSPFELNVQSLGPTAVVNVTTRQPFIFTGNLTNEPFSAVITPRIATITLDYGGTRGNDPQRLLLLNSTGSNIATFPIPLGNIVDVSTDSASWLLIGGLNVGPATFGIKLVDYLNNISSSVQGTLVYDTRPATVSVFDFNDGNRGIATGGFRYYSPIFGSATITINTTESDLQRLVVASGIGATQTLVMTPSGTTHSCSFGGSLTNATYAFFFADTAGNIALGNSAMAVRVDGDAPTVTSIWPSNDEIGPGAAGTKLFTVTFNEAMNPASIPTLILATTTTPVRSIAMNFTGWISSTSCGFSNASAITSSDREGKYYYTVSNGCDYAGNTIISPATGTFTVTIRSKGPMYAASLITYQALISTYTSLVDQSFSSIASPTEGYFNVKYSAGPYAFPPHLALVYDAAGIQVSTITLDISGNTAIATVSAAAPISFFGNSPAPGLIGPSTYSVRIMDKVGNISIPPHKEIVYDSLSPTITAFNIAGVSDATDSPNLYYNPAIQGPLTVTMTTNTTDQIRVLFLSGTASPGFLMTPAGNNHSRVISVTEANNLTVGTYSVTAADLAGNFALGASAYKTLIIDKTSPTVAAMLAAPAEPLHYLPIGGATFTIVFDEVMNQRSATPTLKFATGSEIISCRFVGWAANNLALFTNDRIISETLPQGIWLAQITGTDLAGNAVSGNTPTISIQSRGPIVASYRAQSYQATTATSSTDFLYDRHFSLSVAPKAATLTVTLTQVAASTPVMVHFTQNGATVASYPLSLSGVTGTYIWSSTTGPVPSAPATYKMKLVDGFGNSSIETYQWTMDASEPLVLTPTISGGESATGTVYFNPAMHGAVNVRFMTAPENETPYLRVLGPNSTDTFLMSSAGTNQWSGGFAGVHAVSNAVATDGVYSFDLVDSAGNVALPQPGNTAYALAIMDTVAPVISTYSTLVGGVPKSRYSPSTGNLTINLVTNEQLSQTGVWWLEVRTDSNAYITRIPVVAFGTQRFATWNGTKDNGEQVIDGTYRFFATDYTRNRSTNYGSIYVITSAFKVTGASEITKNSIDLWFNQDVSASSLSLGAFTIPGQAISSVALNGGSKATINFTPGLTHGTSYTITAIAGGAKSVDGVTIASPNNTATLIADAQGPKITDVKFDGLTGQKDFKLIFDEIVTLPTAQEVGRYILTGTAGSISITNASIQSDQMTVLLSAATNLLDTQTYQITTNGVQDVYKNLSISGQPTLSFQGRDLTAPTLTVGAFSNPANESDLVVAVDANEDLQAAPTLTVIQSGAAETSITMNAGAVARSYTAGVHLNSSYPGNGTLSAQATDKSGNVGVGTTQFSVAFVNASIRAQIESPDKNFVATFEKNSLKRNSVVKILVHELETGVQDIQGKISLRPALQTIVKKSQATAKAKVNSQVQATGSITLSELEPISLAYELTLPDGRLTSEFEISIGGQSPDSLKGMGLFRQELNKEWEFVSNNYQDNRFRADSTKTGFFSILRDNLAPRISVSTKVDEMEPFNTDKPKFEGVIEELGSGLDGNSIVAVVDDGLPQRARLGAEGKFLFIPEESLTGGKHSLVFKASDKTGNEGKSAEIQFQVQVPLSIGEIVNYPNPARAKSVLRISANRADISEDLVEIKIYDVAGHKVRILDGIQPVKETAGLSARFLYDIPWDLRNEDGKNVANGVYIAKIMLRDPDNTAKTIKKTHKIAVLR